MSARYLLDSDILIAATGGEARSLLTRLTGMAQERLCLSAIVMAELLTGAEKSRTPGANKTAIEVITRGMEVVPFDADAAHAYGRIRAVLESKGQPIGPLDMLIAAQALSRDLVLVTGNLREFKRVPGLRVENWLK